MGDDPEAPPPPGTNKIEITVGGHTVMIESAEPLVDVISYALGVHEQTRDQARQLPMGFDVTGGLFERAGPWIEPSGMEDPEDADAGRMDRIPAKDGTTRRMVLPDPAGHHRARLGPVSMDRGRATVRRTWD